MLNNPEEQKVIKDCLNEMVDAMIRVSAERDLMKEIISRVKEETTVKPKVFRKMAKVQFQSNFSEVVAENEEFIEIYEKLNESLQDA